MEYVTLVSEKFDGRISKRTLWDVLWYRVTSVTFRFDFFFYFYFWNQIKSLDFIFLFLFLKGNISTLGDAEVIKMICEFLLQFVDVVGSFFIRVSKTLQNKLFSFFRIFNCLLKTERYIDIYKETDIILIYF